MVVKGQSYLEPGDLIEFKLISVDEKNPDGEEDPQYSGRYVISKIRHQVNSVKYTCALECVKDSTKTGFSTTDNKRRGKNANFRRHTKYIHGREPSWRNKYGSRLVLREQRSLRDFFYDTR